MRTFSNPLQKTLQFSKSKMAILVVGVEAGKVPLTIKITMQWNKNRGFQLFLFIIRSLTNLTETRNQFYQSELIGSYFWSQHQINSRNKLHEISKIQNEIILKAGCVPNASNQPPTALYLSTAQPHFPNYLIIVKINLTTIFSEIPKYFAKQNRSNFRSHVCS